MTTDSKLTATAPNFTKIDDVYYCADAYRIEPYYTKSGKIGGRNLFALTDGKVAHVGWYRRLSHAKTAAHTHWVNAGSPAIDFDMPVKIITEMTPVDPEREGWGAVSKREGLGIGPASTGDTIELLTPAPTPETDEEILARLTARFAAMSNLVDCIITGAVRSLIITGPGGVGKTYPTEAACHEAIDAGVLPAFQKVSGTISASKLFQALHNVKDGGVLLLDDADRIFEDIDALNLLKAALDTSKVRTISWLKNSKWLENEGIPAQFNFDGQVIFISNIDFRREQSRTTKIAPHLKALVSRSLLLDLEMSSQRDLLVRIEDMVINQGMLDDMGVDKDGAREIVDFMKKHADSFHSLTLREAVKIAQLRNAAPSFWCEMAMNTVAGKR